MATAVRPESMRAFFKISLIDGFKNHLDDFLHKLVLNRRDAERSLLAVLLGYVNSLGRVRLLALITQLVNNRLYALDAHPADGLTIGAFRHVASFGCH